MKLSVLLLAVSALVNSMAAALSSKVVVPSLRLAGTIKQDGLERAFFEQDKAYWKRIETGIAMRKVVSAIDADIKRLEGSRSASLRAHKKFQKERVL